MGSDGLTDSDTSRHTGAHVLKNSGIDFGLTDSDISRHTRPYVHDRSPLLDILTHEPVCHGVSLSVRPSIPLENAFAVRSTNRNGSPFPAIPSSIESPDAAAYDAALTVFCDFETRNVGGCDLTKVSASGATPPIRRLKSSASATAPAAWIIHGRRLTRCPQRDPLWRS